MDMVLFSIERLAHFAVKPLYIFHICINQCLYDLRNTLWNSNKIKEEKNRTVNLIVLFYAKETLSNDPHSLMMRNGETGLQKRAFLKMLENEKTKDQMLISTSILHDQNYWFYVYRDIYTCIYTGSTVVYSRIVLCENTIHYKKNNRFTRKRDACFHVH